MKAPRIADPLLSGARVLIYIAIAALIFGIVMLGIGVVALVTVGKAHMLAEFVKVGAPAEGVWWIAIAMVLIAGLLMTGAKFMQRLLEIVNTVGTGDAFDPANAKRLSDMGWLGVIGQVIILPIAGIAAWAGPFLNRAGRHSDFGFGFDLGTILLILILFILARVFREGAAMREELEGTV